MQFFWQITEAPQWMHLAVAIGHDGAEHAGRTRLALLHTSYRDHDAYGALIDFEICLHAGGNVGVGITFRSARLFAAVVHFPMNVAGSALIFQKLLERHLWQAVVQF